MAEHELSGDQLAWALINDKDPGMICKGAQVQHDFTANKFTITSFGQEIIVDPSNYRISSHSPRGEKLLHGLGYFFDLAVLWYLGRAKNIPLSGPPCGAIPRRNR